MGRLQRPSERGDDLFEPLAGRLVGVVGIGDVKAVEHQAVGQRVDLGRQDLQALAGQGAGQLVKHARRDLLVRADDELHGLLSGR